MTERAKFNEGLTHAAARHTPRLVSSICLLFIHTNTKETSMRSIDWLGLAATVNTWLTSRVDLNRRTLLILGSALITSALALGNNAGARERDADVRWVGTWTASPQAPEPPLIGATPATIDNQTIRQIVHTSIGGKWVRVRLSNEYGRTPLVIGAAHLAQQLPGGASDVIGSTDRVLTFGGRTSVTIPAGAPALSDPVEFDVPPLTNMAVSIYLPNATPVNTFHSLGRQSTYISTPGNFSGTTRMPVAQTTQSWYFLTGVSVVPHGRNAAAIVAIGDSITDGFASTVDANRRWPNVLANRLQGRPGLRNIAVLDHGISGNRTLHDFIGPNALARFDRDVLAAPGVRWVIVLEGINNIGIPGGLGRPGEAVSAEDIIFGYRQLISRARERGLKIYGGTLTPFEGFALPGYYTAEGEAKRQAVNQWIRTSGAFDAVIDFDKAIRDPANPGRMLPLYDSGDHLHPGDAGYQAMADAIDLSLFRDRDD
jgi:lysophospholipase L1-like esterase